MKNILIIVLLTCNFYSFSKYENIENYKQHVSFLKSHIIDGKKVAYIDEGQGEPLLLLHGIPTSSWMFRKIIPGLVKAGFRVIAPDLFGSGKSGRLKKYKAINIKSQASLMLSLITQHLKINRWSQLVHDMGGPISWEMMKSDKFKVNNFIFLNTVLFEKGFHPKLNLFTRLSVMLLTTRFFRKDFYNTAITEMVTQKDILSDSMCVGYLEPINDGAYYLHRKIYFNANRLKKDLQNYQRLVKSKLNPNKVLVIWGANDEFLDAYEQSSQISKLLNLKENQIHILQGTKHLLTEEKPVEIIKIIKNEMSQI